MALSFKLISDSYEYSVNEIVMFKLYSGWCSTWSTQGPERAKYLEKRSFGIKLHTTISFRLNQLHPTSILETVRLARLYIKVPMTLKIR